MGTWHLYLIRTRYGALYAGIATDVARRMAQHEQSRRSGAKYLRAKAPLALVYQARFGSRSLALRAEHSLKKLPKKEKEKIVAAAPSGPELLSLLGIVPED